MKKVIYTCITGGYDTLKRPTVITKGWDYICYTDNNELKSDFWKIIILPKEEKLERKVKILQPFKADISIWCDASILIRCNLNWFVKKYHIGDFTLMNHIARNCVYEEAEACIKLQKDDPEIINNQVAFYRSNNYPENNGMVSTGIMIRNKRIINHDFFRNWWKEVKNRSRRDQISFNYVANKFNLKYNLMPFGILYNIFELQTHAK